MDYKFYFQQRFFGLIELGNQPFIGGQSPANWSADEIFGLSSHQRMTSFDVAGVGCIKLKYQIV